MMTFRFFPVLLIAAFLAACSTSTPYHVVQSAPDLISADSLHNSVHTVASKTIVKPGKTVSVGKFLYVNELYKGWHIIDNTNPSSPKNVGFITAPGSLDATVSGAAMYIENSVDMVVLDISNPALPTVVKRLQNILQAPVAPHETVVYYPQDNVVVGWHDTTVTITLTFTPFA